MPKRQENKFSWRRLLSHSWDRLLWHWMMGTAMGIFCAGVLLMAGSPHLQHLVNPSSSKAARLIFLVSVGVSFGIGATVTEAMFIKSDSS